MSEPSEQDYRWAASVKGPRPEDFDDSVPLDSLDEEGGMDGLGYDPETGLFAGERMPEEPEPIPVSLDLMRLRGDIQRVQTQVRYHRERLAQWQERGPAQWIPSEQRALDDMTAKLTALQAQIPAPVPVVIPSTKKRGRRAKHGYSGHPIYKAWDNMHQRCFNPKHKDFVKYGAAGVTVCAEWLALKYGGRPGGFERFLVDMFPVAARIARSKSAEIPRI